MKKVLTILIVGALIAAAAYYGGTDFLPAQGKELALNFLRQAGIATAAAPARDAAGGPKASADDKVKSAQAERTQAPATKGGRGPVGPVPVSAAAPIRQDVPVYVTGLGTVQASLTIGIHAQVDGKLETVHFTEGQYVKKGDLLATIDPRLYQAALDAAKARRAQDRALLTAAQKDMERFETLALKNFQSQQSIDQQKAKVEQLAATIAADDAAIETAQTQFDYTSILAPSDGRIGVRLVDPGNIVRASDAGNIASLVLTKPIAVNFTLPAQKLDGVRQALSAGSVEVVAYDQDNRRQLAVGKLLLIDNAIDQTSATLRLKAMFPNENEQLWPGQFINARLLIETVRNALTIPRSAIQRGPKGLFTWVVDEGGRAQPRDITLGATNDKLAIVTEGLRDEDRVVSDGQYKLQVGVPVTVSPPASAAGTVGDRS